MPFLEGRQSFLNIDICRKVWCQVINESSSLDLQAYEEQVAHEILNVFNEISEESRIYFGLNLRTKLRKKKKEK